ncbi:OmpA family protein [Massilia sp. R2A-15]|uniref:OmpA family protein n=1 Tax=Massilia sp. R2A-15 TaxID=3064278 RepID=UPI00273523D6|nr:OmpA family protein [Massilia sp. R2A-15]WLI91073.1 OmpA family protein [Massilia sp. R2A-15]
MRRLLSVLLALALLSSGCSSPPRLNTPDGASRVPINRADAMAEYSRGLERDQAAERDQGAIQQAELLKRDIENLRAYMAASMRPPEAPSAAPIIPPPSSAPSAPSQRRAAPANVLPMPAEIVRADDQVVLFRSFFSNGDAQFVPSPVFQQALVKAAMEGQSIAIWGATDARVKTPASEAIARQRAKAARNFLVGNGVDPAKVRTHFLAAGGFVADNSVPEGRMKNRRVDIEVSNRRTPGEPRQ